MDKVRLPFKVKRPLVACGADLKGAFAITKADGARFFRGFGDLGDADNLTRYERSIRREIRMIHPFAVVCDLHPDYFSTSVAERIAASGLKSFKVQHHEAHIASAIVDNDVKGKVIGVAFDGTGYGSDGNIWGGEFFAGDFKRFTRVAHLAYVPIPGGEAAIKEPWRMAASYIYSAFGDKGSRLCIGCVKGVTDRDWRIVRVMMDRNLNSPFTSSMGRLFDAVGSIVLSRHSVGKEAELPIDLERIASREWLDNYDFEFRKDTGSIVIDMKKTIRGIMDDMARGEDRSVISGKFHNTVALAIVNMCIILRKRYRLNTVLLSGGVFQNKLLRERAIYLLGEKGFEAYHHSRIDTNDSGIPIGQTAIANSRFLCA